MPNSTLGKNEYLTILANISQDEGESTATRVRAIEIALRHLIADPTAEREKKDPQRIIIHSVLEAHAADLPDLVFRNDLLEQAGLLVNKMNQQYCREFLEARGYVERQRRFNGSNPKWCFVKDDLFSDREEEADRGRRFGV